MPMGRSKATNISDLTIDADIPMAGYKLTGLGAGSGDGHSVRHQQLPTPHNMASGSFTGDGSANRAIAHGLGVTPRIVLVAREDSYYVGFVSGTMATQVKEDVNVTVTDWDTTNFYVEDTTVHLNVNGATYHWVAFA